MAVNYHWEQLGVRCLAQGHFDMLTEGVRDQTTDHVISGRPALAPELREVGCQHVRLHDVIKIHFYFRKQVNTLLKILHQCTETE